MKISEMVQILQVFVKWFKFYNYLHYHMHFLLLGIQTILIFMRIYEIMY